MCSLLMHTIWHNMIVGKGRQQPAGMELSAQLSHIDAKAHVGYVLYRALDLVKISNQPPLPLCMHAALGRVIINTTVCLLFSIES